MFINHEKLTTHIKRPKESHFKQLITKYTHFECNAFMIQNKPQTYLIPLKTTTIRHFFINKTMPAIANMSINFIHRIKLNKFNVGFEIT